MKKLFTRKRFLPALLLLALLGGAAWWHFSPRLTEEEQRFVGRWTWPVTSTPRVYPKPLHPPGTSFVFELLHDRTARYAIVLPNGTQAGKTIAGRWKIDNGELVINYWFLRNVGVRSLWQAPPNGMESRYPIVAVEPDRLDLRHTATLRPLYGADTPFVLSRDESAPAPSDDMAMRQDLGFN